MSEGRDDEPPAGTDESPPARTEAKDSERSGVHIHAVPKAEDSCEEPVPDSETAEEETFEIDP
ncbi:MAG TPA: hypothetical protein VFG69_12675, partial [Nannocystaceae bacterium]|nr:hypothetical protein [Nannocystaceae bacterium]